MLMTVLLLLVSVGLTGFMMNRIYVMAVYKAINVKGQHYDRTTDPLQFWLTFTFATFGLFWGILLSALSIWMLFSGE